MLLCGLELTQHYKCVGQEAADEHACKYSRNGIIDRCRNKTPGTKLSRHKKGRPIPIERAHESVVTPLFELARTRLVLEDDVEGVNDTREVTKNGQKHVDCEWEASGQQEWSGQVSRGNLLQKSLLFDKRRRQSKKRSSCQNNALVQSTVWYIRVASSLQEDSDGRQEDSKEL